MDVIAVVAQKGGCGKTTVATNLARSFQRDGRRVLLVDCDNQKTATDWSLMADGEEVPTVTQQQRPNLERAIPELGASFDLVIIDGAAQIQKMSVSAIRSADLVLVPVQPTAADYWSAEELASIVQARREATGGRPKAALVKSRAIVGSNLSVGLDDALARLELPVLEGTCQRVAYARALGSGRGVQDLSPSSKAAAEIDQLTNEVKQLLRQ